MDRRCHEEERRSHLLQMRGLKHTNTEIWCICIRVASFTDAWIETELQVYGIQWPESHLLQMRGLKLRKMQGMEHA